MSSASSGPRPSDRWIPWYLVAFFVSLTIVLVPMCVIAFKTYSGVVTEQAYEKGVAYNHAIHSGKEMNDLHWKSELIVKTDETQPSKANAELKLVDTDEKPIDNADVTAWFVRPTQGGMDNKIQMTNEGGGQYRAKVELPAKGLWEVRVSVHAGDAYYQTSKRVVLQ